MKCRWKLHSDDSTLLVKRYRMMVVVTPMDLCVTLTLKTEEHLLQAGIDSGTKSKAGCDRRPKRSAEIVELVPKCRSGVSGPSLGRSYLNLSCQSCYGA